MYCIVLYRTILETKTIFMLYLLTQMILLLHFSSTMAVQKSFTFSITGIRLSYVSVHSKPDQPHPGGKTPGQFFFMG